MNEKYCPVCGFEFQALHRRLMTGDMCPCCVFEFGVNDDLHGYSYADWREKWISAGCPWPAFDMKSKPNDWDPRKQLLNIGIVPHDYDANSAIAPPWDILKAETLERKRYYDNLFARAVGGLPESSLRIVARDDGSYGVYDPESGKLVIYDIDGVPELCVDLKGQNKTPREIDSYLNTQGALIQAIPRPRSAHVGEN